MSRPKARFICTKPQGLGTGTTVWLQKHGVSVRPSLSTKKIQEITAVFELFDEDDSGAIVVEEAHTALKLLGLRATKSQVAKLVEKYDVNDSGDLDIDEFIQMMTEHLVDQEDAEAEEGDEFDINSLKDSGFNTNELNLVLGALRRRNLLQALLEKDYKGLDLQQRRLRNSVLASGLRPIPEQPSVAKGHRRVDSTGTPTMEQIRKARKESMMMYFKSKRKLKLPKIQVPKKKSLQGGLESPEPKVKCFTGKSPLLREGNNYNESARRISQGKYSTPLLKTIAGGGRGAGGGTTSIHRFPGLDSYMKSSGRHRW